MSAPAGTAAEASAWLAERARATPQRVALEIARADGAGEPELISYAELHRRAAALARSLAARGVGAGDVVAALFENGAELAVLFFALHGLGAVLLPLGTRLTAGELAHALGDSRAVLLLHGGGELAARAAAAQRQSTRGAALALDSLDASGVLASLDTYGARAPLDASDALAPLDASGARASLASPPRVRPSRAPADPLLSGALALLYTSGTSGAPKGAVLGADALRASAEASAAWLGEGEHDRWLVCMPLSHVGGLSMLVRSCLAGGTARIERRFDPQAVSRALDEARITRVSLVANMLDRLLDVRGERAAPPALRTALLGGGATPEPLLERALARGWPIAPTYGLTEAASQVATRRPGDAARPLGAGLSALPGNQIRVVGEDGRALAVGEAGEIVVRGPTLMRGYLLQPEASARALSGGWLHTGDIGVLDGEGRLAVLDRRDDLIVSGGENVYPAEIEAVLLRHPAVAEAGVVGIPDARFGARPVAYWVPRDPAAVEPDLAAHCRAALAAFKVPVAFHRRAALPRTASGKLRRRELGRELARDVSAEPR